MPYLSDTPSGKKIEREATFHRSLLSSDFTPVPRHNSVRLRKSTTSRSSLASQSATVAAMFNLFRLWCGAVIRIFRAHRSLMLENLALRQQLAVLKRKHPRPRLGAFDKLFWVVVRHLWSDWDKVALSRPAGKGCSVAPGWIQTVLDHALQSAKTGRRWRENLQADP